MTGLILSLLFALAAPGQDTGAVIIKGQRFQAEVARTPEDQARGLMYRDHLDKDRCMIFLYDQDGGHTIWMKNCLISLDVIWVKADGRIAELQRDAPPLSPMFTGPDVPTYGGKVPARHFIELPAGTLKRLGVKVGDRVGWDLHFSDGTVIKGGMPVSAPKKK